HVRAASAATGRECRIAMDLAGPKLRTGPLQAGPPVIRLRPTRDSWGRAVAPARCWLTAAENPSTAGQPGLPTLPVPGAWLAGLNAGDTVTFRDTRDSRRRLRIEAAHSNGALASTADTAYLATGTILLAPDGKAAAVEVLPPTEQYLTLRRGDSLRLTRDCAPAIVAADRPASIGCTLPEVFRQVAVGDLVHLDDGKISATVIDSGAEHITLRITNAARKGSRLRAAKGINLPDTVLPIPALTDTDRANLGFIAQHADLVELSFVRTPQDVEDLLTALAELDAPNLGIVIKVETALGFQNLPAILLVAMRRNDAGVMIARGDLASECGYERLAELQEEVLWLCEAAHLPVIWATQVLDQLARSGQPSRAEITDAAMGERAECVMLNKGPHILEAVASLDDILCRMATHHYKKNALMRPLRSWRSKSPTARIPAIGTPSDTLALAATLGARKANGNRTSE
ncbi:MAG: pyruvate kinase, partial [Pseudonocardiales bacterium]